MKTEIVIARYNEDLSWLKKIPKSIKITVYNKGLDDIIKIPNVKYDIIKLPNVGRESHTYLYHIIHNYDNLAHKTIFCQGDSIFHSPGFLDLLKNVKLFEPVQPLSAYYWPEGAEPFYFYNPPKPLLDETKNLWIKKSPIHVEYMDNNFVTRYPYVYNQHHFVKLVDLAFSSHPGLKVAACFTLKNLLFRSPTEIKGAVMSVLTYPKLLSLLEKGGESL
jgi:hypothetical protein